MALGMGVFGLTVLVAQPKPEPDVLHLLLEQHNLQRKDLVMIGNAEDDVLCADACGIDYISAEQFL